MATESGVSVATQGGTIIVDGFAITVTPTTLTAGQSFRQSVSIGDASTPGRVAVVDADNTLYVMQKPYLIEDITSTGTVSVGAAKRIVGVINNSTVTQTASFVVYDNPSAATGTVRITLYNTSTSSSLGPGQIWMPPAPGIPFTTGFTVLTTGSWVGSGTVQFLYEVN